MGTDIHAVFQAKRNGQWFSIESKWGQVRDYFLFAWLAGVRNGFGFAGVKTHEPIEPIAAPRGVPHDYAVDHDDSDGEEYLGDHDFSWLGADEILNAPLPSAVRRYGVIDREVFDVWDGRRPQSYCGDIGGHDVVLDAADAVTPKTTHVKVSWVEGAERLDYFLSEVRRLRDEHGDVRMVFGFDS